jgi:Fur family ferric uptake transcriptional regulator
VPQSAEEIHQKVTVKHPNISLDTVYRNLNVLLSIDLICKFNYKEGKSSYEINKGNSHHHHLVCLKCGAAEPVDFCPLKYFDQKKFLKEKDFEIKEHRFEIYGYCADCKNN